MERQCQRIKKNIEMGIFWKERIPYTRDQMEYLRGLERITAKKIKRLRGLGFKRPMKTWMEIKNMRRNEIKVGRRLENNEKLNTEIEIHRPEESLKEWIIRAGREETGRIGNLRVGINKIGWGIKTKVLYTAEKEHNLESIPCGHCEGWYNCVSSRAIHWYSEHKSMIRKRERMEENMVCPEIGNEENKGIGKEESCLEMEIGRVIEEGKGGETNTNSEGRFWDCSQGEGGNCIGGEDKEGNRCVVCEEMYGTTEVKIRGRYAQKNRRRKTEVLWKVEKRRLKTHSYLTNRETCPHKNGTCKYPEWIEFQKNGVEKSLRYWDIEDNIEGNVRWCKQCREKLGKGEEQEEGILVSDIEEEEDREENESKTLKEDFEEGDLMLIQRPCSEMDSRGLVKEIKERYENMRKEGSTNNRKEGTAEIVEVIKNKRWIGQ